MKRIFFLLSLTFWSVASLASQITFTVDMTGQVVSADGIHLAGSFQNWDPAATEMIDSGNNLYSITLELVEGSYTYKFINGNAWSGEETVPSDCGTDNGFGGYNRSLNVLAETDAMLPTVCYSSCSACAPPINTINVTFKVDMSQQTVSPNGVHIAGSFQGWNPSSDELTDADSDGVYEGTFQIQEGIGIDYKFINGNDWPFQESVPMSCGENDGFGGYNRHYALGSEDVEMLPICFGECYPCTPIIEPTLVTVTFQVNMNNETVSADGVFIAGEFNGWNSSSNQMTDMGNGVYEASFELPINMEASFRFINGNSWDFAEIVPELCGVSDGFGSFNRNVQVFAIDTIVGPICFSECADCLPVEPVLVTLRVDMANETVSSEGVYVAGEFNNWDPTATAMSLYAPGKYEAVVVMNTGQTSAYKFLNGPDFTGVENVPSDCGTPDGFGGFNRSITAVNGSNIVPVVCFSSCSECVVIPTVQVTFRVNMSEQVVSPDGVHIAGSFNNFSPTATPMLLENFNIYTATIEVPENEQITYKYINGIDWPFAELVPFECGIDDGFGGYNRIITTDNVDVITNQVCFNACSDCTIGLEENLVTTWMIFPSPANSFVWIENNYSAPVELDILNLNGEIVMSLGKVISEKKMIDISSLSSGVYFIRSNNGEVRKLVISK